ncbi:MAG: hypothetical protein V3U27_21335 [Candidatus Tectomicrobia bacterium]
MVIEDGRRFRYTLCGSGLALVVGALNQGAIPEAAKYNDQAVGTMAAGVTQITGIGATTTSMPASDLIDGYCWSEQEAQLGPALRIKDNIEIDQAASDTGTINLYTALPIAIDAAETISYIRNTWRNTIVSATTITGLVAGVSVSLIAASGFGWLQTQGPCKVGTSGSPAIISHVIAEGTAAGEITVQAAAVDTVVGKFMMWETSNENGLFWLTIE